jgi:hypothetical protein
MDRARVGLRGAFLEGNFADGETLYLKVPQGMESWYGNGVYLLLRKTFYGLKQSAYRFWIYLLTIVHRLRCERSKADPCLYFKWTESGALLLSFSWVDDCVITGPMPDLIEMKKPIMRDVECEDGGELTEFFGCKIYYHSDKNSLRLTQPVLLQNFKIFKIESNNQRRQAFQANRFNSETNRHLEMIAILTIALELGNLCICVVGVARNYQMYCETCQDIILIALRITLMQCIER